MIREAKRLCASNGNEKLLEKNKIKADKLLREVFALKRIKDDEISKFGIIKFEYLQDILQNPQTDDRTRVMAKVVRYKSLSSKIVEFQEKFPDYDKHISWKKTKKDLTKKKGDCITDVQVKRSKRLRNDINNPIEKVHEENVKIINDTTPAGHVLCQKERNVSRKCEKLVKETKLNVESKDNEGNSMKMFNIQDVKIDSKNDQSSNIITKVISNEATVKRFTEVLQETKEEQNDVYEATKNQQPSDETTESSKNTDDFFLHTNEVTLRSNDTLFSKEKNSSSQCNINHNVFKSHQTKKKRDKLCNEKIYKEKRNNRKEEMNCANVFYDRNDTSEIRKQKRKGTQVETREKINRTSSAEYKNLHPSWVAKKKQQDIMKQGFQGKKIKFDEN